MNRVPDWIAREGNALGIVRSASRCTRTRAIGFGLCWLLLAALAALALIQ
jgi:hypothetical protein